jgi:DNA transformation protein
VLATKLYRAGITCYDDLADLGSVEAYLRIWEHKGVIGYNMLYAIEGAIQGVRWHDLPREQRQAIKHELLTTLER